MCTTDVYGQTPLPYVCFKFVQQEAVGIYYIPWPPKKLLPKFLTKFVCQKQTKSVQPAQPTGQSCQKMNFKKTYGSLYRSSSLMSVDFTKILWVQTLFLPKSCLSKFLVWQEPKDIIFEIKIFTFLAFSVEGIIARNMQILFFQRILFLPISKKFFISSEK